MLKMKAHATFKQADLFGELSPKEGMPFKVLFKLNGFSGVASTSQASLSAWKRHRMHVNYLQRPFWRKINVSGH